jgi:protein TonB
VTEIKLPLVLSAAGHAVCVLLLALLPAAVQPLPQPIAKGGIEVVFEPSLPKAEAPPLVQPVQAEPPPEAEANPVPPPEEPAVATEPVPLAPEVPGVVAEPMPPALEEPTVATAPVPPPPPHKPVVKPPPKAALRPPERAQPAPALAAPAAPAPPVAPAQQTASTATPVPAPVPSPEVSAGYRGLLSAWLNSHKRYPEPARQRGEEGRAVLSFEVDRSGRVVDYAVAQSTGHPDLDEAIEEMMRGAQLPPFPADMTQPRLEVSVTIRFSLTR